MELNSDPAWVISGTWSMDGTTLYLIDALKGDILPVSVNGVEGGAIRIEVQQFGYQSFSAIQRMSDGYLLEMHDGGMVTLDSALVPQRPTLTALVAREEEDSAADEAAVTARLTGVYAWLEHKGEFLVFGDVQEEAAPYSVSGFVRVPSDDPGEVRYLLDLKLSRSDPMSTFYRLGLSMFAEAAGRAYVLVMDGDPYLAEVDGSSVRLIRGISTICGRRQRLPETLGEGAITEVYKTLESSEGPLGVYSHFDSLYLLCRQRLRGKLRYLLAQIDVESGKLSASRVLETRAENLLVVPGPRYWAFVEKGPVQAITEHKVPYMPVESVLFASSTAITGMSGGGAEPVQASSGQTVNGPVARHKWIESLLRHVSWIFSGVGIVLGGLLVELLRRRRMTKERS